MGFRRFIAAAWLVSLCAIVPAHAEKRVALIIGNGAYQYLRPLNNPPNDARGLAFALQGLGFDVDLGVDLALVDMQRKVTAFARRAQTADVALAFFAGHGVQASDPLGSVHPVNYLLPVDADIKEEADLGFMLTARDILARLQAAGSVRIMILDACRDNPIAQRLARGRSIAPRGLSPEPRTNGTLIAYSTQPGTVADDGNGRNSPFMTALLAHIAEPGQDIRLLFAHVRRDVLSRTNGAQTPETSDSLDGLFAFNMATAGTPPVASQPPVTTAAMPDEAVWSILKDTGDIDQLRRFVSKYPASAHRAEAEARIRALMQTAISEPARPAASLEPGDAQDLRLYGKLLTLAYNNDTNIHYTDNARLYIAKLLSKPEEEIFDLTSQLKDQVVRSLQREAGLPQTGRLDVPTLRYFGNGKNRRYFEFLNSVTRANPINAADDKQRVRFDAAASVMKTVIEDLDRERITNASGDDITDKVHDFLNEHQVLRALAQHGTLLPDNIRAYNGLLRTAGYDVADSDKFNADTAAASSQVFDSIATSPNQELNLLRPGQRVPVNRHPRNALPEPCLKSCDHPAECVLSGMAQDDPANGTTCR